MDELWQQAFENISPNLILAIQIFVAYRILDKLLDIGQLWIEKKYDCDQRIKQALALAKAD